MMNYIMKLLASSSVLKSKALLSIAVLCLVSISALVTSVNKNEKKEVSLVSAAPRAQNVVSTPKTAKPTNKTVNKPIAKPSPSDTYLAEWAQSKAQFQAAMESLKSISIEDESVSPSNPVTHLNTIREMKQELANVVSLYSRLKSVAQKAQISSSELNEFLINTLNSGEAETEIQAEFEAELELLTVMSSIQEEILLEVIRNNQQISEDDFVSMMLERLGERYPNLAEYIN